MQMFPTLSSCSTSANKHSNKFKVGFDSSICRHLKSHRPKACTRCTKDSPPLLLQGAPCSDIFVVITTLALIRQHIRQRERGAARTWLLPFQQMSAGPRKHAPDAPNSLELSSS